MSKIPCRYVLQGLSLSPDGFVKPCCVWQNYNSVNRFGEYVVNTAIGSITKDNIDSIYHSKKWNDVRKYFVNEDKLPPPCTICEKEEKHSANSPRLQSYDLDKKVREEQLALWDKVDPKTGAIEGNHIDFLDIRFSNLCNMKCRMCGPTWSSLWAEEENYEVPFVSCYSKETFDSILEMLPNIRTIYFAGGEPLLSREHYLILEELIRQKNFNIHISYNSNCSVLQYKNQHVFDLWKYFKQVDFSVSIDHYGERAEYIRHGTDWGVVENNLVSLKNVPNITASLTTLVQFYNYPTYHLFHDYMKQDKFSHISYLATSICQQPHIYSPTVVPVDLKVEEEKMIRQIEYIDDSNNLFGIVNYANSVDKFEELKDELKEEIFKRDKLRGEDFYSTFPEYAGLFD